MSKERYALSFDEMTRARYFFHKHADEYITEEFQMRTILSEMGQYPPTREISFCLDSFNGKLSFNNFCNYLCYLKKVFSKPEPKDVDTLRAFVALGGAGDRSGDISTEDLKSTCKHFHLTIDIEKMIQEVDEDQSGSIDYEEFAGMWQAAQDSMAVQDEQEENGTSPSKTVGQLQPEPDIVLDEEEELQVVKGFLFPLTRKATVPAEVLSKRKSVARSKSVVRLPQIGGRRLSNGPISPEADEDPKPQVAQTARQSNAGFIVPDPKILTFRGRGRTTNKGSYSTSKKPSSKLTPRPPPSSARGTSSYRR